MSLYSQHGNTRLSNFKLVAYLRCIHAVIQEYAQTRPFEALVRDFYPGLFMVYHKINNLDIQMDANKLELIRLLHTCATVYPSVLELVSEYFASVFIDNHITVRQAKDFHLYNTKSLPTFYKLVHLICKNSPANTAVAMQHSCIHWAIKTFIVLGEQYPQISETVMELLDFCITSPGCPEQVRFHTFMLFLCVCLKYVFLASDGHMRTP
jgi:hypothetical protein